MLFRSPATRKDCSPPVKGIPADHLWHAYDERLYDRRAFLIGLTEQGRAKIEAALPDHIKNIQQALSILEEDDKQDLIRILKNFKKLS